MPLSWLKIALACGVGLYRPPLRLNSLTPTDVSACFITRLTPGEETLSSRAAPPTVPVTMIARMTSIWRNVSISAYLFSLRRIAREILRGEFVEIILPIGIPIAAEIEQIVPVENSRRVHVIEHEPHSIIADGQDFDDLDIAFTGNGLAFVGRVTLHLRTRALHPQIFRGQIKPLTAIVANGQGLAILVQAQFGRPDLRVGHQLTNRTMPVMPRS